MSHPTQATPEKEKLPTAHSLREAADTDNTLQGYAAMNDPGGKSEIAKFAVAHPIDEHHDISRRAHQLYLDRGGENGSAEDDWCRAEQEVRAGRGSSSK